MADIEGENMSKFEDIRIKLVMQLKKLTRRAAVEEIARMDAAKRKAAEEDAARDAQRRRRSWSANLSRRTADDGVVSAAEFFKSLR